MSLIELMLLFLLLVWAFDSYELTLLVPPNLLISSFFCSSMSSLDFTTQAELCLACIFFLANSGNSIFTTGTGTSLYLLYFEVID
jgi:hypothetical protein